LVISEEDGAPAGRVSCTVGVVPADLRTILSITQKPAQAIDWRRDAPLLQHVAFDEVIFGDDPAFAPGENDSALASRGYEPLVQGPHGPLAVSHSEGGNLRLALLFHPDRSTLPYRVGFPVLVSNLVQQARAMSGLGDAASAATGVLPPLSVSAPGSVTIDAPGRGSLTAETDPQGVLTGISAPRVGEYRIRGGGAEQTVGVSLLSRSETGLAAVEAIAFSDRVSVAASAAVIPGERSLWRWLAWAGLAVLLVEWWWFQRRAGA
jgi:hypothetical protein